MLSHVLLVGTNTTYTTLVKYRLASAPALDMRHVDTGQEALRAFETTTTMAVVNATLSDGSGLEFVQSMRSGWRDVPILLLVRPHEKDVVQDALQHGVTDVLIAGSTDLSRMEWWLKRARTQSITTALPLPKRTGGPDVIVGRSPVMCRTRSLLEQARQMSGPILLQAESGTEPDRWAQAVHEQSADPDAPFVTMDCALYRDASDAEALFGGPDTPGACRDAGGGTLFLENVGLLDDDLQQLLLSVARDGRIPATGADAPAPFKARLVCGTCHDLERLVDDGAFNADLYDALTASHITLPLLRDRNEDILMVAQQMLRSATKDRDDAPVAFSVSAMEQMLRYDWPGNTRELRSAIRQGVQAATAFEITAADLFPDEHDADAYNADEYNEDETPASAPSDGRSTESQSESSGVHSLNGAPDGQTAPVAHDQQSAGRNGSEGRDEEPPAPRSLFDMKAVEQDAPMQPSVKRSSSPQITPLQQLAADAPDAIVPLEELQLLAVEHALHLCGGDMQQAARALGVPASTIVHFASALDTEESVSA